MTEQSNALALKLAAFWTMKNDQGQYLYSSLNFREETAEELRRLVAQRDLLLRTLKDCEIALRTVAKDDEDFHLARQQVRDIRDVIKAVEE